MLCERCGVSYQMPCVQGARPPDASRGQFCKHGDSCLDCSAHHCCPNNGAVDAHTAEPAETIAIGHGQSSDA
jgi:hypothetical protein